MRLLEEVARYQRGRGDSGGDDVSGDVTPYLCAGCDVYLTREPCALCAMALVHARARRVLFGVRVPQGALCGRYRLHGRSPPLNHRYRAFGGVRARECEQLGLR
ncbi:hypothetical protein AV530_011023 [Patagioenas fasciata monilis]|uniref:CMP/dCMP-type deaminase domain-containing protein n=1 Tax=Patagioenas fasciata monilis TaxID=372326 RepID=A0A1V4KRL6_PATFA|nr:hypothetical protein AV530_011023 [Patagioenas fasciata monilis]